MYEESNPRREGGNRTAYAKNRKRYTGSNMKTPDGADALGANLTMNEIN